MPGLANNNSPAHKTKKIRNRLEQYKQLLLRSRAVFVILLGSIINLLPPYEIGKAAWHFSGIQSITAFCETVPYS